MGCEFLGSRSRHFTEVDFLNKINTEGITTPLLIRDCPCCINLMKLVTWPCSSENAPQFGCHGKSRSFQASAASSRKVAWFPWKFSTPLHRLALQETVFSMQIVLICDSVCTGRRSNHCHSPPNGSVVLRRTLAWNFHKTSLTSL